MRVLLAALLIYISTIPIALAQTRGSILLGLSEINLLIEDLSDDARPCGVTRELIEQAFMYPASSAQFRVSKSSRVTFYIRVTTINAGTRGCLNTVLVQVYSFQSVTLIHSGQTTLATVELWQGGTLLAGPPDGQQVKQAVENYTKQFITDWNLDNR